MAQKRVTVPLTDSMQAFLTSSLYAGLSLSDAIRTVVLTHPEFRTFVTPSARTKMQQNATNRTLASEPITQETIDSMLADPLPSTTTTVVDVPLSATVVCEHGEYVRGLCPYGCEDAP